MGYTDLIFSSLGKSVIGSLDFFSVVPQVIFGGLKIDGQLTSLLTTVTCST